MKSKKRKFAGCMVSLFAIIILANFGWKFLNEWDYRRMLPRSAINVTEWYRTHGILPDYAYLLRAQIPEDEFQPYIKKFEMTIHMPDRVYEDAPGRPHWPDHFGSGKKWWDPTDNLNTTYVYQKGDEWVYAKYENGWLYLKALNH